MANLAGTYSSSRSYYPYLDYTIAASEVGRTATSVTYRFSCSVSIASSGGYGYDIILNYNVGGVTGTKTIKTSAGGFPSSTGNFDIVVSGQSASGGTNAVSVTMWSTSSTDSTHWQNAFNTGTKYLDRSNFNTAPSMTSVTVSGVANGAKVWENTSSVTVVCVASDSDGNLGAFQIERYVNDALNATYDVTTGWTKSGNTYTLNYSNSGINSLAQGAKVHYRVRAKDSYGEWSGYTTSGYFNLNKLTGATLTSSDTSITWSDTKVSFSYSGANNTNGDGTFTYQFWNNAGLTMYNNGAVASYSANQIDITTWGTTDAGRPYFDVTELKNFVKDIGDRTKSFTLYLRTFNSAGSYIDSAVTIIVSLKPVPTTPGTPTLAGTITASGASRYVPNVGGTYTLTWTASTDQTGGTGLTYEIEANFNNTGWYTVKSNLTALTYDISADVKRYTLSAATNYQARVVAHTEYVTEATSTARSITLDYWYAPDITIGKVTRANTSYSVPITAKVNSSFAVISSASWSGNGASGNLTITSGTASGTASQTIAASTSFTLTATVTDNSGLTGATQTDTQAISKYQPIISMRSLGLGVNAFADSTYIFKVGGKAMFGSAIGMTNSDDTFPRIVLQAYTGDTNGMGLALQSGGMMFVGAGESATALATQWDTDGGLYTTEHLFLGADSGIYLASNCGTIANRKVGLYTTTGNLHVPGAFYEASDIGTGGTTWDRVYSPNNKPTPATLGAIATSGTQDGISADIGTTGYIMCKDLRLGRDVNSTGVLMDNEYLQSGNILSINTGQGIVKIGPQNTTWCHFDTTVAGFYFYKPLTVGAVDSYGAILRGETGNTAWQSVSLFRNSCRAYYGIGSSGTGGTQSYPAIEQWNSTSTVFNTRVEVRDDRFTYSKNITGTPTFNLWVDRDTSGHGGIAIGSASTTYLKWLRSTTQLQVRDYADTAYTQIVASAFTPSSKLEFKQDIVDTNVEQDIRVLKDTTIRKYRLRAEVEEYARIYDEALNLGIELETSVTEPQVKHGLIIEELTDEAREVLKPNNAEGIDLYTMTSILWSVCKNQQQELEKTKADLEMIKQSLGLI